MNEAGGDSSRRRYRKMKQPAYPPIPGRLERQGLMAKNKCNELAAETAAPSHGEQGGHAAVEPDGVQAQIRAMRMQIQAQQELLDQQQQLIDRLASSQKQTDAQLRKAQAGNDAARKMLSQAFAASPRRNNVRDH